MIIIFNERRRRDSANNEMKKLIVCALLALLLVLLSACTTLSETVKEPIIKETYKSILTDEQEQVLIDTMKMFDIATQEAIKEQNLLVINNYERQFSELKEKYNAVFPAVSPTDFTLASVWWDIGAIHNNVMEVILYYHTTNFFNLLLSPEEDIEIEPVTEIGPMQGTENVSTESLRKLYDSLLATYFE